MVDKFKNCGALNNSGKGTVSLYVEGREKFEIGDSNLPPLLI